MKKSEIIQLRVNCSECEDKEITVRVRAGVSGYTVGWWEGMTCYCY